MKSRSSKRKTPPQRRAEPLDAAQSAAAIFAVFTGEAVPESAKRSVRKVRTAKLRIVRHADGP